MDRNEEPKESAAAPGSPEPKAQAYSPPAILWEQEFVALALVSSPNCVPGSEDFCNP